jgi:hypothetical protein
MTIATTVPTVWWKLQITAVPARDFEDLSPGEQIAVIVGGSLCLLVLLAITVTIIYLLYKSLDAVPPEFREMEPSMVWLLLIPCFNLVWNFFVYTRVARSYQNYFHEHGRFNVGDCGAGIGIAYSVCVVLVSIPCLNYVTGIFCGPAALVLQIIYLVKLYGYKRELESAVPEGWGRDPDAGLN